MKTLPLVQVAVAICAPDGMATAISRPDAESLAALLKVVADPTRLQLISYINSSENSESCVCELTQPLHLSQPTISHHLKVLSEAGLLEKEKRGTWVWYSVNQKRWNEIANLFNV